MEYEIEATGRRSMVVDVVVMCHYRSCLVAA
jgi:hypothetical protein